MNCKLKNYQFHAKYFLEKENYMVDYLSRYLVEKSLQILKEDIRMSKFIEVVLYTKKEIWILIRLKASMKKSLQVVFGKMNEQESIIIIKREVKKEIGLSVT